VTFSFVQNSFLAFLIDLQNHNYAVDPDSLPDGVEVTHINLNDGTCAGLCFPAMKVMSIQYHPESSPGPHDADSGSPLQMSSLN
jgi:carbamoyl-phosphate synthase small subunit